MGLLTPFRLLCYWALLLFSAVTIGLTAARLHYTLHLPPHDPLNGGVNFHDPIIVEILVVACATILFTPFLLVRIHGRHERGFVSTFGAEMAGLLLLFALWTVGAAIATQKWGKLNWCHKYTACRLLTAIVAFTWMSWVMVLFLASASIGYICMYSGFTHPVHGVEEEYDHHDDTREV